MSDTATLLQAYKQARDARFNGMSGWEKEAMAARALFDALEPRLAALEAVAESAQDLFEADSSGSAHDYEECEYELRDRLTALEAR